MYSLPKYKICKEVQAFQNDCELLTKEKDTSTWMIDEKWAKKFEHHLNTLEPIAEAGDPWAQYSIAVIYMLGYLYTNEDQAISSAGKNNLILSKWLEKAAKQGFITAVDNLITSGVGEESDRLRKIFKEVEATLGEPFDDTIGINVYGPEYCERVWEIAYKKNKSAN